jgi:hypothetical protein
VRVGALPLVLMMSAACTAAPHPVPSGTAPGTPPLVIASILFQCPASAPFALYGHVFYPPTYPGLPAQTVRPTRCFATAAAASAAGYTIAPTPTGDLLIGGVYLVPTGAALLHRCEAAAARLRFAVPCPELAPFNWSSSGGWISPGLFVLSGGFSPTPRGYIGLPNGFGQPQLGHLNVWAIPMSLFGPNRYDYCVEGRAVGTTSVGSHPASGSHVPTGAAWTPATSTSGGAPAGPSTPSASTARRR